MKWTMCKVYINNEAIEAITYMLTEQGIQGVEVVDNTLSEEDREEIIIDYIEDGVIDDSNDIYIKFYLSAEENIEEKLEIIRNKIMDIGKFIDVGTGKIELASINDEDWANNWKKYYKPFKIDNIIIKPTWEDYIEKTKDDVIIEIDPGMAFGSGTHETTSMCISKINKYLDDNNTVIDVGCGSGILGITAAKLGASQVTCIDLDKNAVKVAKDNAITNNVEDRISVLNGDLLKLIDVKANIVVANIMADIIMILAKGVSRYLLPNGIFISSGIILDKVNDVERTLIDNGFEIIEIERKGEWAVIVAKIV